MLKATLVELSDLEQGYQYLDIFHLPTWKYPINYPTITP